MNKKIIAVIIILCIATYYLFPSEEKKVLNAINSVKTITEIQNKEHPITIAVKIKKILLKTTSNFKGKYRYYNKQADLTERTLEGQESLKTGLLYVFNKLMRLDISLENKKVAINGDTASVTFQAKGVAFEAGSQKRHEGKVDIEVQLEKRDGDWLITLVEQKGELYVR